mgnify:FL=1
MKITVLIPYYDESSTIISTLDNLKKQTLEPDKVILIDSGSNDSTSLLINGWIEKNNKTDSFSNIFSGKMSPSSSINLGLTHAQNKLIAYVDCGLEIPLNWLEDSFKLMQEHNSDIVSKCIYTEGENVIDKSLVAQTYGYMQTRPCLTGSLIKSNVFDNIGFFLDNVRSGYDVDFINRINSHNIKRIIDYNNPLKYYGNNYAANILTAFKKVFTYSLAGWITKGDKKPILYLLFVGFFYFSFIYNHHGIFIASYIFIRGYLVPYLKSYENSIFLYPYFLLFLPISGLIIDVARFSGYLFSLFNIRKIIEAK